MIEIQWFLHEVESAGFHGVDRHVDFALARDVDYRKVNRTPGHFLMEFETAHFRHTDIGQKASRLTQGVVIQELARGFEGSYIERHGFEQQLERLADAFVVVDDINDRRRGLFSRTHRGSTNHYDNAS